MIDCASRDYRTVYFFQPSPAPPYASVDPHHSLQVLFLRLTSSHQLTSSYQVNDMQFKTLLTLASFVAVAFAAPADPSDASVDAGQLSLTTHFTTDTFTATRVLQSIMTQSPFITTLTQTTVWTVEHTVTRAIPTPSAAA
ncbi:hypothetical protein LXA43DRAFT_476227 [Ganoderma leucocontextum]|nr:hypothetical protein LXA43DRAFT_476227 [Ganoderma leucocontextum]